MKNFNVLFVDNPVGTGYSYVDDVSLLTTTNDEIGKQEPIVENNIHYNLVFYSNILTSFLLQP